MFPVITKERQDLYEDVLKKISGMEENIPEICGFHGRACRKMDKEANTMLCMGCSLKTFVATVAVILEVCNEKLAKNMERIHDSDIYDIQNRLKEKVIHVEFSYIENLLDCLSKE